MLVASMDVPADRRTLRPPQFSFGEEEDAAAHADALGSDLRQLPTGLPAAFTVDDLARLIAAVDAHAAAAVAAAAGVGSSGRAGDDPVLPRGALLDASECWTAGGLLSCVSDPVLPTTRP